MTSPWKGGVTNSLTLWLGIFGALIIYWIVAGALF
ncbi:hypothetical protein Lepto7375DRAFT_7737 [Leptolyngbya sp. PCC 7375]|nr:hypothetical protein Lepto7375DRAFT_7737 [Leptolyngbya sp. PCC 7375]